MQRPDPCLSISELASAGVHLHSAEAVTIVRELALKVSRGEIPGVPSSQVIRISPDGALSVEGPVSAGGRPVARAAQLLESLLPGFDAPVEFRAPGALRLIVARALGTLDLPPYESLESFAEALARFASPDPAATLAELASSGASAIAAGASAESAGQKSSSTQITVADGHASREFHQNPSALTISDIRRARRATGLTLTEIAGRTRIPAPLLRELEWGYLRNWPGGHYGRTQLVRYARAAGLDDEVVVDTVWPMLQGAVHERGTEAVLQPTTTPVAEGEILEDLPVALPAAVLPVEPAPRNRVLAALALVALLTIALLPAVWYSMSARRQIANMAASLTAPGSRDAGAPVKGSATSDSGSSAAAGEKHPREEPPIPTLPAGAAPSETGRPRALAGAVRPSDVPPAGKNTPRPASVLPRDSIAYSPAFATAGSAMFSQADADGRSPLMRADTNAGGEILKITTVVDDGANNFHARPSPDGTRIAFDSDRDGERAVYVADSTGHNVRKVSGDGFAAIPTWSPDGERLAFVRAEANKPQVWNLWTVELGSGEMHRLTSHPYGQPWGGSWFPDGRHIAYGREDDLIILDIDTGARRVYHTPKPGHQLRTPAVSPDGRRIIFQVNRDGAWVLELSDGSMRKVLSDPSADEYAWSPDGRRVAFHSRRSGEWGVWLMAAR